VENSLLDLIQGADIEWKPLGEILIKTKGTKITAKQMKELDKSDGSIKIFAGGKTVAFVNYGDIPEKDILIEPSIIVKSRGIIEFEYYNKPFSHKSEMWSYHSEDKNINIKYVYYYLKMNEKYFQNLGSKMQMPQIATPDTERYKIPIPSLEIQQKVVEILDKMTDYVTELTAELTAELTLRQKQYAYYRDQLLTFDVEGNPLSDSEESLSVRWTTLGEIADIGTGSSNTNEQLEIGKYPFYVRSQEVRFKDEYEFDEVATLTSGDGVGVGKIYHFVQGKYALHQRAYRIHITNSQVDDKYFFYFFQNWFTKYIEMQAVNSSVTSVRKPMLEKFQVAIPNLVEQKRIVKMLDKFDKLTSDLSEGLPREIELRQKQYEYWREQLLSFK
jgi:Restriction endonuclease S subunits